MIKNVQALRFVFVMLVVMSHIIGRSFDFGGECGVSFFFMLSGFVLSYAYGEKVQARTFGHRWFILKQLSKFYPLHVLLFIIMIILDARLGYFFSWDKMVANLLLIQSWVPSDDFYFVGNGLSWFLSDLMFFYIVFPMAFRLLVNVSCRRLLLGIVVILALYVGLAVSVPVSLINPLLYAAPWTRLLDFSVGILLFRLYASAESMSFRAWINSESPSVLTLLELVLIFAVAASFFVYGQSSLRFRCAALFWFVLPVVLFSFVALDNHTGKVTQLLHSAPMQWLGSISLEIYLTHCVFMRCLYSVLASFGVDEEARRSSLILILTVGLILVVSYLTQRYFVAPVSSRLVKVIR